MSDMNLSYTGLIQKTSDELIPLSAQVELTHGCNLNCMHCYIAAKDVNREELSLQEICNLFDQLADQGCLFLTLTGGEILTREDFFPIARYARQKNFAVHLLTNGTLITADIADKIAELRPLSVDVSIYGVKAETHDAVTRMPGSFDKTRKAINLLKQRNLSIILKTPVIKKNVNEYQQIAKMAETLGAGIICDPRIIPKLDGSKDILSSRIDSKKLHDLIAALEAEKSNRSISQQERLKSPICAVGKRTVCISPCGDIFPCALYRLPAGNLRKETFKRIWEDSQLLSNLRSLTLRDLLKCAACESLTYCNPCMGLALLENGELNSMSSMTCSMANTRRNLAAKRAR